MSTQMRRNLLGKIHIRVMQHYTISEVYIQHQNTRYPIQYTGHASNCGCCITTRHRTVGITSAGNIKAVATWKRIYNWRNYVRYIFRYGIQSIEQFGNCAEEPYAELINEVNKLFAKETSNSCR